MKRKKRSPRRRSAPPCGRVASDDGIDPRSYFRPERDETRGARKTQQLCAQAARAIRMALAADCGDPLLHSIEVLRVEPAPDATRLKVVLRPLDEDAPIDQLIARLEAAHGLLRSAVAESIRRRNAPELALVIVTDPKR